MTQYQLYMKSGVPKSTIGNIINCSYDSVKLRIIHEMCQGLGIGIDTFFASPLFKEDNLEPYRWYAQKIQHPFSSSFRIYNAAIH